MILSTLRERTRPLHDRAERAVDLPARLASSAAYAGLLARFHGFYAPLEARLDGVDGYEEVGLDLSARRKAPLLREDLAALGCSADAIRRLPLCEGLPDIRALPQALGCLYVLEGATLGGQLVRKEVARALGLAPGAGCSFFSSYRGRVGPMWNQFCIALSVYSEGNPGVEGTIVSAAEETFRRFVDWVSGEAGC